MVIVNLAFFVISILILFYSGGLLVKALIVLGRYFKISEYVLSFILVAFATSLPEFFIGINSALQKAPLLSLGNIIGANVLNITLVLGIAVIFAKGLDMNRGIHGNDSLLVMLFVGMPVLLVSDRLLSRWDGAILLLMFGSYILYLTRHEHENIQVDHMKDSEKEPINLMKNLSFFFIGTILLLASSSFAVYYGIDMARKVSLPLFIVGVLVSIGTTLPEIVFSVKAVSLKHGSMSLGNAFGSIILNIALILGLVAVIHPIRIENLSRTILGFSVTAVLVIALEIIGIAKKRLEYWMGVGLVLIALLFVITEAIIK